MLDQFDLFSTTMISSGLGLFPAEMGAPASVLVDPVDEPVVPASRACKIAKAQDIQLGLDRALSKGWRAGAGDNVAAIRLAAQISSEGCPATPEEQAQLVKFVGFGATDLAQNVFRRPGEAEFRRGWTELGTELEQLVERADYAALARSTQYAHYTPEPIARAM